MARVEFSDDAISWLRDAGQDVRDQVGKRFAKAEENPDHFLTPLTGRPTFKLRTGVYRAEIQWVRTDDEEDVLFVRRVGHRDGFWD